MSGQFRVQGTLAFARQRHVAPRTLPAVRSVFRDKSLSAGLTSQPSVRPAQFDAPRFLRGYSAMNREELP